MKKILVLSICIWGYVVGNAQQVSSNLDERLTAMYSVSQIAEMQASQPQTLAYLNYYVQNGFQILENIPAYKLAAFSDISTLLYHQTGKPLTEADLANLNILKLDIVRTNDQYLTYKIGDTGKVIVFLAPSRVLEDFNNANQ